MPAALDAELSPGATRCPRERHIGGREPDPWEPGDYSSADVFGYHPFDDGEPASGFGTSVSCLERGAALERMSTLEEAFSNADFDSVLRFNPAGLTTVTVMGEPELPETAGARFELFVEDERRVGWAKAIAYAFVFWITFEAVELYPKATVRVRDRVTGEDVVTQTWSDPRGTGEAVAQLQEDLVQLTPGAFWIAGASPPRPASCRRLARQAHVASVRLDSHSRLFLFACR